MLEKRKNLDRSIARMLDRSRKEKKIDCSSGRVVDFLKLMLGGLFQKK